QFPLSFAHVAHSYPLQFDPYSMETEVDALPSTSTFSGVFVTTRELHSEGPNEPEVIEEDEFIEIPPGIELEPIGEGGQAVVYSCHLSIQDANQKVTIKSYGAQCSSTELAMLRKLEHANIVKFYGLAKLYGQPALVLEFCDLTVRSVLSNYPLENAAVSRHALAIARGIGYLHANKTLHRDLKPENVLIDSNGVAKLCDFGIARDFSDHSTLITVMGTRPYMAPELIRNEKCSEKIDVWSFGILLWEMMTCRRPYEGIDEGVLMYAIGKKKAQLPMPENGEIESLPLLLNRCWAEDPHDRASMERVIGLLANFSEELE
ncbi:hypothetical protein PFISCL1PPCAC_17905, partial [Pristionchus fissidentatus]